VQVETRTVDYFIVISHLLKLAFLTKW
jgi:hypothetical protein